MSEMTTRRWIVNLSRLSCPRHCGGELRAKVVDREKGIVRVACRACGTTYDHQLDAFKEMRPCARCKDVRDVTVKLTHGGGKVEEHWKRTCSICDIEMSAGSHYATAKAFFERARKLRVERAGKKAAGGAP